MTIFSKIIKGEIPCYKIAENEDFFAFLDINPLSPGHTLIVPKVEVDCFFDLPAKTISEIAVFAQKIAIAIKENVDCLRVGMIVFGLEVPHAHIHLIPIRTEEDMSFSKERELVLKDEMIALATQISNSATELM